MLFLSSQKRQNNILIHRTISRYQVGITIYTLTFYSLFVAVLDRWFIIAQAGFELKTDVKLLILLPPPPKCMVTPCVVYFLVKFLYVPKVTFSSN